MHNYRGYATLVLEDKKKTEFLLNKEGVGQGDPLSMLMYAAAVIPDLSSHFPTPLPGSKIGMLMTPCAQQNLPTYVTGLTN